MNSNKILTEIKRIENEFKDNYKSFIKCVNELKKYLRIESSIDKKNDLSLKKLF